MAKADGTIEIKADFDIIEVLDEVEIIGQGFEELKTSITGAFDKSYIESFGQSCGNLISELSEIEGIIEKTFSGSTGALQSFVSKLSTELDLAGMFDAMQPGFDKIYAGTGKVQTGIDAFKTGFDNFKSSMDEAIPSADSIGDSFNKVKTCIVDVKTGFGEIKTGVDTFKDGFGSFESGFSSIETGVTAIKDSFSSGFGAGFSALSANLDTIKTGFNSFKEGFDAFKSGVDTITGGLETVKSGFEAGSDVVGIIKDVGKAVSDGTAIKAAGTLAQNAMNAATIIWQGICAVAAGVTTAFGAAMNFLFGPIGLIIIAIVALIAVVWLLIANWDWVKEKAIEVWTAISEFFAGLWASITEAVTIAWQAIIDFIVGLWTGLSETAVAVWTAISDFFTQLWATITAAVTLAWQTIVDFLLGLWSGLSETAVAVWTGIADFFTGLMDNIKLAFSTAWEGIKEVWGVVAEWFTQNIIEPIQTAFEGFKTAVVGTWDGIWAGIKGVINSILGGIECFINSIIGGVNNLIANLNSLISLGSKVTEALGLGEIGFISPLGSISLPRLAKGAVIPPNRKFLALLGDQTSGTNIETPLTTMIDAFKTALTEMGGGSGDFTVTMPVYLDSEKIYEGQKRVQSRRGTSIVKVGATA